MRVTNLGRKKRIRTILLISFGILILLIIRIGIIQFIDGSELQAMAYSQQTLNRTINPKRGTIYDITGKNLLAVSSTVETITINPVNIKQEEKEKVTNALCTIFELDYETVIKKVRKKSSIETIIKKVDKEKADELRVWLQENEITEGVNIDEDTKRYYPNNALASQVIGFCGADNQGLDGIEAKYDEILKGTMGSIQKVTDAKGSEIGNEGETYVPAIDGKDIILSIDLTIQSIAEKYLKEACIDNQCTDGGNIVIMNPKTGDVLAMATYPNYNLNTPYEANTDELKEIWETLSSNDKTKNLQQMWRNKAIADTYEPGSTFKLITTSAALEEGITTPDVAGEFYCNGSIEIAGVRIRCWRHYRPHGSQSLREALMNSCNPVFIALGQRVGVQKYYQYLEKFGYLDKTGIDLNGEAKGIFLKEEKVGPVELATISFGQRFEVTPIQMVAAASAIANGGTYIAPRIVKGVINESGEIEENVTKRRENIISEQTAKDVLSMMETVVSEGTGKNAKVKGYLIGGKTGTSEDGVNTNKYITSFLGIAPISDPELVILITLYNPTGEGGHQGGGVAAPIGGQVLGEILPYLELQKDNLEEVEEIVKVTVPNIRKLTLEEAKKTIKEIGLELEINLPEETQINESEIYIKEQLPLPGINLNKGSKIMVEI